MVIGFLLYIGRVRKETQMINIFNIIYSVNPTGMGHSTVAVAHRAPSAMILTIVLVCLLFGVIAVAPLLLDVRAKGLLEERT